MTVQTYIYFSCYYLSLVGVSNPLNYTCDILVVHFFVFLHHKSSHSTFVSFVSKFCTQIKIHCFMLRQLVLGGHLRVLDYQDLQLLCDKSH